VTLTTRLLVFFLSMLALVLGGFSSTLYWLADNYLERQVSERLDAVLNTLSAAIEAGPGHVEWEPASRHLNLDFSIVGEQVVWLIGDDRGQIVDRSKGIGADLFLADVSPSLQLKSPANESLKWQAMSWKAGQRWIHADLSDSNTPEASHGDVEDGDRKHRALSITAGVSLLPLRGTLRQLLSSLVGLSVGIWVVGLFAGRFVCGRALLPVSRMARAVRDIDADDLTLRLPAVPTKNDELEELNRAFNSLLDRLQVAFERQRSFTGDASHQLRTPLTALLGQVEVALRRERTPEEYRQVLSTVQQRSLHLSRMVESLLFLARADAEARRPLLERLNLTEWLPQHVQTWREYPRAGDISLDCPATVPCDISAQPALLAEMLDILLDNSCKYSEPGTAIKIGLKRTSNAIIVTIEDHGHGMDEKHLANLFIPFRRSEDARRRGIPGVGLGLSIAKRLAEVFGGDLSATSRVGAGSCFTVRFPEPR
jgi:two-component system OmpR family sensor kinase